MPVHRTMFQYQEHPPLNECDLTAMGRELQSLMLALMT